jgi:very-short-patch-repair endonuclease
MINPLMLWNSLTSNQQVAAFWGILLTFSGLMVPSIFSLIGPIILFLVFKSYQKLQDEKDQKLENEISEAKKLISSFETLISGTNDPVFKDLEAARCYKHLCDLNWDSIKELYFLNSKIEGTDLYKEVQRLYGQSYRRGSEIAAFELWEFNNNHDIHFAEQDELLKFASDKGHQKALKLYPQRRKELLLKERLEQEKRHAESLGKPFYDNCESEPEILFAKAFVEINELKFIDPNTMENQTLVLKNQFVINKFRADFIINNKLVVEIDGRSYHSDAHSFKRDREKDRTLQKLGFQVFRYTAQEIYQNANATVYEIINHLNHDDSPSF